MGIGAIFHLTGGEEIDVGEASAKRLYGRFEKGVLSSDSLILLDNVTINMLHVRKIDWYFDEHEPLHIEILKNEK